MSRGGRSGRCQRHAADRFAGRHRAARQAEGGLAGAYGVSITVNFGSVAGCQGYRPRRDAGRTSGGSRQVIVPKSGAAVSGEHSGVHCRCDSVCADVGTRKNAVGRGI